MLEIYLVWLIWWVFVITFKLRKFYFQLICLDHSNPTWLRKVSLSYIKIGGFTAPPLLSNPQLFCQIQNVQPDSVVVIEKDLGCAVLGTGCYGWRQGSLCRVSLHAVSANRNLIEWLSFGSVQYWQISSLGAVSCPVLPLLWGLM